MSEIRQNIDGILEVASQRFLELMTEASQNVMEGITSEVQQRDAQKILTVLQAYAKNADMETDEVDALLYCLLQLSEADQLPAVPSLLNQIQYVVSRVSQVRIIVQNDSIDLPERERINFHNGLSASDDGDVIHVQAVGGEYDRVSVVTAGPNIEVDMDHRKKRLFVGDAPIDGARTWDTLLNTTAALEFILVIDITGTITDDSHDQQLPGDFLLPESDGGWIPAGSNVWRPQAEGRYVFYGVFDGSNWNVTVSSRHVAT